MKNNRTETGAEGDTGNTGNRGNTQVRKDYCNKYYPN